MTTIAQNKAARFEYEIIETLEAGLVLLGSEVKSLRRGKCSLNESFIGEMVIEGKVGLYLFNVHIAEYSHTNKAFTHETRRPRELLVHSKERNRMLGAIRRKGLTIVPLQIYFNERGRVKVQIALAKGRKLFDKRQVLKDRDWKRDQARLMKQKDHS